MPIGVVVGLFSAILTAVITEIYCHRCLAHRAFGVHPAVASVLDMYFRVIVWTDPESWAVIHRLHHRYADMPEDPHSPRQRPPLAILVGSPYLFAMARRRLAIGSPPTRAVVALRGATIVFPFAVFGLVEGLTVVIVHLVCYLGIMGMVNMVGHLYGRKPHPEFAGYDLAWLAIPLLGHGYHNSHHAHPAAARTGPLDPIWPLLRLLDAVGVVELDYRRARTPSRPCCGASVSLVGRP
ncbi:MAG: fatty acid desaturase [Actinomycetota bacterium]|nr:fatty acid desaturase [Actinomycetota bacterium]